MLSMPNTTLIHLIGGTSNATGIRYIIDWSVWRVFSSSPMELCLGGHGTGIVVGMFCIIIITHNFLFSYLFIFDIFSAMDPSGRIYAFGGYNVEDGTTLASMIYLDPASDEWLPGTI